MERGREREREGETEREREKEREGERFRRFPTGEHTSLRVEKINFFNY